MKKTAASVIEIPVLPEGQLPPLLVNKDSSKGRTEYKVLIYKNVWNSQKKRSERLGSRTAGVLFGGSQDGFVRFENCFIEANPWLEDMR